MMDSIDLKLLRKAALLDGILASTNGLTAAAIFSIFFL